MAFGKKTTDKVVIPAIKMEVARIPVNGIDGPLVVHNWSAKAIGEMLSKQMHLQLAMKEAKDPEEHYRGSLYLATNGKYGFPAVAFKSAMVRASKGISGLTMTDAKQMFFIVPDITEEREFSLPMKDKDGKTVVIKHKIRTDLVQIFGNPEMRMDMVRLSGGGAADVRFRGQFIKWKAVLAIRYLPAKITKDMIANLVNVAGQTVGIGEGRAESGSDMGWGRFEISGT